MFKPTRGPQRPSFRPDGISPQRMIKFLEDAQKLCLDKGEAEGALMFECMAEYFRHDYKPEKGLTFRPYVIGY